jgi:hypothetical protein
MPKAGDKVLIDVGQANDGRWYWRESRSSMDLHGPFLTESEADQDAQRTFFGPNNDNQSEVEPVTGREPQEAEGPATPEVALNESQ